MIVGVVVVCLVVGGLVWLASGGASGRAPSASATVAHCSAAMATSGTGQTGTSDGLSPSIVGVGPYTSIAAFDTGAGWKWCFDGLGVGGGAISTTSMHAAVGVPLVLLDGPAGHDALVLVHHDLGTVKVVIDTVGSRSTVLSRRGAFEVLSVPIAESLHWHVPWPRSAVAVGQVLGFDRRGLVTSSAPFTFCPGSIDSFPGRSC